MIVHLLAFASAADLLGGPRHEVEIPAGSRVEDLAVKLLAEHPELRPLWARLAIAVDGELVGPEQGLTEGAEVALLPPVSGGAPERAAAQRVWLGDAPLKPGEVVASVESPGRGAVVVFEGRVRNHHHGAPVRALTYEAYESMARGRLATIIEELEAEAADLRVAIAHRLGDVEAGVASVVIATASPHRAAAYDASRRALERLKVEVPIWKREHFVDGTCQWREEEPLAPPARVSGSVPGE